MSMADYYQDQEMEAMADRDNEIDRQERIAKNKALEERIQQLILQNMGTIKLEITAIQNKTWIDRIDKMFITRLSSGKQIRSKYIVITDAEWQSMKREMV